MTKEILCGIGKCNKSFYKIKDSTSEESYNKILSALSNEYKNVFIVQKNGEREIIKGCEDLDINKIKIDTF